MKFGLLWLTAFFSVLSFQQGGPEPPSVSAASSKIMTIRLSDEGRGMVDAVQAEYIIENLDRADTENYDLVILIIDTFGGQVFAAREINERLLRMNTRTLAFVETKAISAGTFIAWACDEIVMASKTTMGDAQMVFMTMEGMQAAPEKQVTVYRSDWKKASDAKNRSFALARGFFEPEVEVLQVAPAETPTFMLRADYDRMDESERPEIIQIVVEKDQLLTLYAEEAAELGIVSVYDDFDAFLAARELDQQVVNEVTMTFNQRLLRYLGANPWIYLILVIVGLNGLYAEIKAPGFGIPGLTALVCFTVVFGSRYLLGTADMFELLLFGVGILLAVVEIFVLPGFGIAGIAGLACMVSSLVLASVPDLDTIPSQEVRWDLLWQWIAFTFGGLIGSILTLVAFFPALLSSPFAQRHMLPNEMTNEEGYVARSFEDDAETLKGLEGVAIGGLRPGGKMELDDGRLLDVSSDAGFVEPDVRIRIYRVEGNRIVVRPIEEPVVADTTSEPESDPDGESESEASA